MTIKLNARNALAIFIINICRSILLNVWVEYEFLSSMHFGFFTVSGALIHEPIHVYLVAQSDRIDTRFRSNSFWPYPLYVN